MKKILIFTLLASSSVFAESQNSTYSINTNIYVLDKDQKSLISSISQLANNNGERNPAFISREVGSSDFKLEDGVLMNSRIIKMGNHDMLDFVGTSTTIESIEKSKDDKWQEGHLKTLSFKTSMWLDKPETNYKSSFDADGKKYLLEMNAVKINYIADLKKGIEKTGFLTINGSVEKGKSCSSDGLISRTKEGIPSTCVQGIWK